MAGVDTSIYSQIQQPDPMQRLQGAAFTADLLSQAQQNRMALQAKQGLSQAYQQATDPVTGQVDRSKLAAIVSQDPRTAFQTADVQQNANAAGQGAQNLDFSTWQNAVSKQNYAYQLASSLGGATPDDARGVFQHAKQMGLIPADQEAAIEASIPGDPTQMGPWAADLQRRTMSGLEQLHGYGKQLGWVNNGQQQIPYQANPNAPGGVGPMPGAAPIQNQLSPESQGSLVQVTNPDGSTSWQPAGAVRAASGAPISQGGAGYTGRPPAPMPASLPTSAAVGLQAGAQQSAQAYTNATNAGNAAQGNIQTLQGLKDAISGGAQLGPGTEGLTHVQSWLMAHGMSQSDASKVQNSEEAYKFMQQYANQMSTAGTGTDARLNAAQAANPNPAYSKNTNMALVDRLSALEHQNQDIRDAFQASGQTPDKFQEWLPQFQKTHGIGVYQFDSLTPKAQQAYLGSMNPSQRQQWASGYADYRARNPEVGQ